MRVLVPHTRSAHPRCRSRPAAHSHGVLLAGKRRGRHRPRGRRTEARPPPLMHGCCASTAGAERRRRLHARHCLIDARYRSEVRCQLGLERFPRLAVLQMDASRLTFPDSSFDLNFSSSVFHHLPDPEAGSTREKRVLRPGGVAYISLQLFTSATGCLDPRYFPASTRKPLAGHT